MNSREIRTDSASSPAGRDTARERSAQCSGHVPRCSLPGRRSERGSRKSLIPVRRKRSASRRALARWFRFQRRGQPARGGPWVPWEGGRSSGNAKPHPGANVTTAGQRIGSAQCPDRYAIPFGDSTQCLTPPHAVDLSPAAMRVRGADRAGRAHGKSRRRRHRGNDEHGARPRPRSLDLRIRRANIGDRQVVARGDRREPLGPGEPGRRKRTRWEEGAGRRNAPRRAAPRSRRATE